MIEALLTEIFLTQSQYSYLTQANKAAVERLISDKRVTADPQITPQQISGILGISPQCNKSPSAPQIQCTWTEKDRQVRGYWSQPWKFQYWDTEGF